MATILVADDDVVFCEFLRVKLGAIGHAVTVVNDGRAAEAAIRRNAPDLLLIDIIMPDQDGLETIRNLRSAGGAMKIIAMSSGGNTFKGLDFLAMARRFGANTTITKPIGVDELQRVVASVLQN